MSRQADDLVFRCYATEIATFTFLVCALFVFLERPSSDAPGRPCALLSNIQLLEQYVEGKDDFTLWAARSHRFDLRVRWREW
jgi:hypothetical protein